MTTIDSSNSPRRDESKTVQKISPHIIITLVGERLLLEGKTPVGQKILEKYSNKESTKTYRIDLPKALTVAIFKEGRNSPSKIVETQALEVRMSATVGRLIVAQVIPAPSGPTTVPAPPKPQPLPVKPAIPKVEIKEEKPLSEVSFTPIAAIEEFKPDTPTSVDSPKKKTTERIPGDDKTEKALELLLLREAQDQREKLQKDGKTGKGWAESLMAAAKKTYPKPANSLCEMIQDIMHPMNAQARQIADKLYPFLKGIIDGAGLIKQEARFKNDAKQYAEKVLARWGDTKEEEKVGVTDRNLSVAQLMMRLENKSTPLAVQSKALSMLDHALKKELASALQSKDSASRKTQLGTLSKAIETAKGSKAFGLLKAEDKRGYESSMSRHQDKIRRVEGK